VESLFLGISFAKMGVFSTVGVALRHRGRGGIPCRGHLAAAILVLAGPRGWVKPRRELTARFWRRSGARIVRRPKTYLVASVLVLAILASCATLVRYNYDDRKAIGPSASSSIGYAALERHFPISQAVPEYVLVQSPRDLRTPQALADLEQMAQRVSQLPNIGLVSGITRPTGVVRRSSGPLSSGHCPVIEWPPVSAQITGNTSDLNRLANGAGTLAASSVMCGLKSTDRPKHAAADRCLQLDAKPVWRRQVGQAGRNRCPARAEHQRARNAMGMNF